jgi:hypothetical protein
MTKSRCQFGGFVIGSLDRKTVKKLESGSFGPAQDADLKQ